MKLPAYPLTKPSAIEWLGDVPEHWEEKQIRHLISAPLAYGVLKPDKYDGDDAVPLVRILDIAGGIVQIDGLDGISPQLSAEYRRTLLTPGDLVVSVVGTIGRCFVVPDSLRGANLSRALARVQLQHGRVDTRFVEYCLNSHVFEAFVGEIPTGTAQRVLNLWTCVSSGFVFHPSPSNAASWRFWTGRRGG